MFYLLFHIVPCIVWFTLLVIFLKPLKLNWKWYLICALILFAASQKFVTYRLFGHNSFNPDLPCSIILGYSWIYSCANILCCLTIAYYVLRGVLFLLQKVFFSKSLKERISVSTRRKHAIYLVLLASIITSYGLWEGIRIPRIKKYDVYFKNLPAEFEGYKIVHLTDLHCSPATTKKRFETITENVNQLSPDLICITGDFVDGTPQDRLNDLSPIANLKAKDGVYGCAGNHEFYCHYDVWRPELTKLGIKMLDNTYTIISRGNEDIALGGLTDPKGNEFFQERGIYGVRNISQAFKYAPEKAFRILMDHRPMSIQEHADNNISLQLTGHTHGGAIFGMHWAVAKFNEGYVNGLYKIGNMTLHVSPGTGQWAGFPIRLVQNSAITLITLHKEK